MPDPAVPIQKADQVHLKLDIPLRPLPSTKMAHYQSNLSLTRTSEGDNSSGCQPTSIRVVKPAPCLITLDDYNLISLGYKPVMSRSLSWISMTGVTVTASNVLCGVIALYGLPLTNGGPAWITWCYLVVGIMSCIVSLCLAELAAAYPATAGVHHWVYQLAPSRQKPFLTWMTGWLTLVGAVASASSVAFYFSSVLGQVLYSLYRIALTPGMLVMFHLGAVLFWQAFNLFPVRGLGYISTLGGIYIVGVAVTATIVILSHLTVDATLVHVPFTVFLNYSGNSSTVYASLSSALMASFVFCPQDSVIRMSEEVRRPERIIPGLVVGSNLIALILGFPLVIALNYAILQPMKGLLDEVVPAVRVILVTLGRPLGPLFVSLIIAGIFFTGLVRLSMATRIAYAFSRDAGFPKSSYWNHLHPRRKTPQRISWIVAAACMSGIFPFYWGDNNAFHWIASLACIATNLSFVIPLWMRLTKEGNLNHTPGPFALGGSSRPLYTISILWLLFISTILMLPTTFPLTRGNFNYAPAAIAAVCILAALSWVKAKYSFTGAAKEGSRAANRIATSPHRRPSHATISSYYTQSHQYPGHPLHLHQHHGHNYNSSTKVDGHALPPLSLSCTRSTNGGGISFASELLHDRSRNHTGSIQARTTLEESRHSRDRGLSRSHGTSRTQSQDHSYTQRHSHSNHSHADGRSSSKTISSIMTTTSSSVFHSHQSQPVSILGVPLSSSPEIAHRELRGVLSSSVLFSQKHASSHPTSNYRLHYEASYESSSLSSSPVLSPIRPTLAEGYNSVPEISIAPPTTISSGDDSRASSRIQSPSHTSMSDVHVSVHAQHEESTTNHNLSCPQDWERKLRAGMTSPPPIRPPNATESIFPELAPTTPSTSSGSRHARRMNTADNLDEDNYSSTTSESRINDALPIATMDLEIVVKDTQVSTNPGNPIVRPRMMRRNAILPPPLIIPSPTSTIFSNYKFGHVGDSSKKEASKAVAAAASTIDNTIKVKGLHVDDSFDEEYHHQYPVVSAYQSTQELFNVLPSPISTSIHEMAASRQQTMIPSPVSGNNHKIGNDDNGYDGGSDNDDEEYEVISNAVKFLDVSTMTRISETEIWNSSNSFNDKNQAVARWAQEQAKIHEWRMEKKRVQVLHGQRKSHGLLTGSATVISTGASDSLTPSVLNSNPSARHAYEEQISKIQSEALQKQDTTNNNRSESRKSHL